MRFARLRLVPIADLTRRYSWASWCQLVRTGFVGTVWNDGGGWYSNDPAFVARLFPY